MSPSRAYFEFEFLEELFSVMTKSSCSRALLFEIQHIHGERLAIPILEHELVAEAH